VLGSHGNPVSQGELLNIKNMSWVDILQLTRTVSQKKSKVEPFFFFFWFFATGFLCVALAVLELTL
jgi:hypothetical protein